MLVCVLWLQHFLVVLSADSVFTNGFAYSCGYHERIPWTVSSKCDSVTKGSQSLPFLRTSGILSRMRMSILPADIISSHLALLSSAPSRRPFLITQVLFIKCTLAVYFIVCWCLGSNSALAIQSVIMNSLADSAKLTFMPHSSKFSSGFLYLKRATTALTRPVSEDSQRSLSNGAPPLILPALFFLQLLIAVFPTTLAHKYI